MRRIEWRFVVIGFTLGWLLMTLTGCAWLRDHVAAIGTLFTPAVPAPLIPWYTLALNWLADAVHTHPNTATAITTLAYAGAHHGVFGIPGTHRRKKILAKGAAKKAAVAQVEAAFKTWDAQKNHDRAVAKVEQRKKELEARRNAALLAAQTPAAPPKTN